MPSRTRFLTTAASTALVLILIAVVAWGYALLREPAQEPLVDAPVVTQAEVIRNTDGDTAQFRLESGVEEKVRFIGIDTPEVGAAAEPYGAEAAAYTRGVIPVGTTVWLETDAELRDKHGRLLAYVWLEQPVTGDAAEVRAHMLNARIVLDGFANAYTYPPNVKYTETLKELQSEALDARRGFWAE